MKNYYRIMLGRKSIFADECYKANCIGAGWLSDIDLTKELPDNWRDFNKKFIPKYLEIHPDKSKVAAGLACGFLHTISKGIQIGDIVIRWNDQPIQNRASLSRMVARSEIGTAANIVVLRDGEEVELAVTLGRRPDRFN